MIKVAVDRDIPFLEERLHGKVELISLPDSEITPEAVKDADALLVRTRTRCGAPLLAGSRVRFVATATAGEDHIDRRWCEANGIEVVVSSGCNAPGVAQYALSALLRTGFRPGVHTLGVVGKGNVGSIVAAWARQLGISVIVSDPPRAGRGLADEDYLPLDRLLAASDAVTFHVPLLCEGPFPTLKMLSGRNAGLLKPHTVVINAARGGVIDEKAVLDRIGDAGRLIVDTWENEPLISLETLEKAFIATPHIAGYSLEGKQRATRIILEGLSRRFGLDIDLNGLAPRFVDDGAMTLSRLLDSFDPFPEMRRLKDALTASPRAFDTVRNTYRYRPEPL